MTLDAEYPLFLTTGRVVSQFLSGTQTRRIGPLVKQYPEPRIELHPRLAAKLGDRRRRLGDLRDAPRRDHAPRDGGDARSGPTRSSFPTTGRATRAPNRLTVAAQDPISKIPQYKVCGCRAAQGRRAARVRRARSSRSSDRGRRRAHAGPRPPRVLRRPEPLHRLPGVRPGLHRVRHAQGRVDDPPRVRRPGATRCRRCRSSACTASSRPAPRSARPTRSSAPATASCRPRASRAASPAATACWPARSACPRSTSIGSSMMKCDMCYDRTSRRQEADVRDGLPEPGALLRHPRADPDAAAAVDADEPVSASAIRRSRTRVNVMVPRGARAAAHRRRHRGDGRAAAQPDRAPSPSLRRRAARIPFAEVEV